MLLFYVVIYRGSNLSKMLFGQLQMVLDRWGRSHETPPPMPCNFPRSIVVTGCLRYIWPPLPALLSGQ